jgi:GPH family glycoside/pentoside/hexuronide:cation symporter
MTNNIQHVDKKLTLKEKIAYGAGDFGNGFMFDLGQIYLLYFFTNIAHIDPIVAGGIFFFTKIFDAFMDPIAGIIIDSQKKVLVRGNKFRHVMIKGAVVLALLTVLTFTTFSGFDDTGRIVWAYATYMAWGCAYAFTNTSYGALSSVMTRDVVDRAELAKTRSMGSVGAQLVTGVLFMPIVGILVATIGGSDEGFEGNAYTITAAIMAICGVLAFYFCYTGTVEYILPTEAAIETARKEKKSIGTHIKEFGVVIFTNRALGCMILMQIFTIFSMNINNTMMKYFTKYNLDDTNGWIMPTINFVMMGCTVLASLSFPYLTKKFGKKKLTVFALIAGALADFINFLIPTSFTSFIILVTLGYVMLGVANGMTWAFVSDAIDYGHWNTGVRREGTTFAVFNFSRKIAQSLAGLISGLVLSISGYNANLKVQSDEALSGIKMSMTLYPAIALILAAAVIFFLYNLTDKRFKEMSDDLNNHKWKSGTFE